MERRATLLDRRALRHRCIMGGYDALREVALLRVWVGGRSAVAVI